jgi:serine/threonine-protein kinase
MGTAIAGRYVLIAPVGYGGVSVVYQAVDTHHGVRIAVKLLSSTFADDPYARDRVRQEALITNRLRHPSVPRVYDYGDALLPDGRQVPYVAMELLTGAMLAGRLADGALPWPEAVKVAATIADVLAIAHRRGVVHRDLTPTNIMMTGTGPKIIDFGEAITVEAVSALALDQPLPTRRVSSAPAPADDVYALGVLLYQMLTGHSPYPAASADGQMHAARMRHIAPTPVLLVPGLPRVVAEVCRSCMAKRPEERPVASEVALALWSLMIDPAGGWTGPDRPLSAEPEVSSEPAPLPALRTIPAPRPDAEPRRPRHEAPPRARHDDPPGRPWTPTGLSEPLRAPGSHRQSASHAYAAARPKPYSTGSG